MAWASHDAQKAARLETVTVKILCCTPYVAGVLFAYSMWNWDGIWGIGWRCMLMKSVSTCSNSWPLATGSPRTDVNERVWTGLLIWCLTVTWLFMVHIETFFPFLDIFLQYHRHSPHNATKPHLVTCWLVFMFCPGSVLDCFIEEDKAVALQLEVEACWTNNWGSAVRQRTAGRLF